VPDWKDFAVVLCLLLVVIGTGALVVAAQSFTILDGRVLEKGTGVIELGDGSSVATKTISVLIEEDDRVYKIKRGSVVRYAISDEDAQLVGIGSDVRLLISQHSIRARLIDLA